MEEKQPSVLADLCKADLRNVNLSGAYLREAGLVEANRKAAEVGFARETRRSNLRGISQAKSERVRRKWIPTTTLIAARNAPAFRSNHSKNVKSLLAKTFPTSLNDKSGWF